MWESDFFKIDGITYHIPIETKISRTVNVLDKYAKRVSTGALKRKIVGVYKNYVMNFSVKQDDTNYSEYNELFDKLTEPKEFHNVKIGNYTFKCYITSVSDKMYLYKNNKEYYEGLTAEFIAESPWRS